jgi:N-methylhydantoinase B/oxoprolinase/acetone carboxylase alpha subunit
MGVTLQRTAYSPNIKERLDFSCALFDPAGQMVAHGKWLVKSLLMINSFSPDSLR